jgi:predicted nucleotide-binding protein
MALNQVLFEKIRNKRGLSRSRLYALIQEVQLNDHVSPHVALLKLASEVGIGINRYATDDDRAELRATARSIRYAPPSHSPASKDSPSSRPPKAIKKTRDNSIFVVHGRDIQLRDEMYSFLRALGLNPIEWDHAIKTATGGANPIVGEVIDNAMQKAQGIMVLLSPDEEAKLKNKFSGARDKKYGLNRLDGQPRPNVIFEAGLALGAHSDKTILVQVGDIREISDIAGKHIVHLTGTPQSRKALAQRLKDKLKFKIDTVGGNWLEIGQFRR